MKPTVVLVGRPNVGKSTLFNRLTRSRDALVADLPGLTRDRHYGHGLLGDKPFLVVDTGGFEPTASEGILHQMAKQTELAVSEADVVIFLVDGRSGLTAQDKEIAERLRKSGRSCLLAVNKCEGLRAQVAVAEFHELGFGEPIAISAAHGEQVGVLIDYALRDFPPTETIDAAEQHPKIAVVGRPNVGKSTLINTLLGEERLVVFDQPGTTRDSIYVEFERAEGKFVLIDTAGVRRRGKVNEAVEKFSVIKTLQAIEDAQVVILVIDASEGITEQDAHIAGFILEAGRALVVVLNKWDGLPFETRERVKSELRRKLHFLNFARLHFISALENKGLDGLFVSVREAHKAAMAKLSTPRLTRALQDAVARQAPPRSGLVRPKLRYAHQGGSNPPRIIIHGNALNQINASYRRYLEHFFREQFKLIGTPLAVQFKSGNNPYRERRKA